MWYTFETWSFGRFFVFRISTCGSTQTLFTLVALCKCGTTSTNCVQKQNFRCKNLSKYYQVYTVHMFSYTLHGTRQVRVETCQVGRNEWPLPVAYHIMLHFQLVVEIHVTLYYVTLYSESCQFYDWVILPDPLGIAWNIQIVIIIGSVNLWLKPVR